MSAWCAVVNGTVHIVSQVQHLYLKTGPVNVINDYILFCRFESNVGF